MSWPTLVQLMNSEKSHAYDGSEVRETWYIEPYDAETAFMAAMLGRVDAQGVNPQRTLPAQHYLYRWCFAAACESVPYDPRSISYMGATNLQQPADGLAANMQRLTSTVGQYKQGAGNNSLNPTAGVDTMIMGPNNRTFSAGAFVCVTYLPLLTPNTSETIPGTAFDLVNHRLVPQMRTNTINAGLHLTTPPMAVNLFGAWNSFYPAAGVAPILKEEYQELVVERRMLLPTFDLTRLSPYQNLVNGAQETLAVPGTGTNLVFPTETLRFQSYKTQYVQLPSVDASGEPNGYNRWLNLELHYDWRVLQSMIVHDDNGDLPWQNANGTMLPVTWNHILAYPGLLSWLNGVAAANPSGLGWYKSMYSAQAVGVDSQPYPKVTNAIGNGAAIFDTITQNW